MGTSPPHSFAVVSRGRRAGPAWPNPDLRPHPTSLPSAGQVGVRRNVGGGTFVAGYRRALTEHDSLEAQGMVGAH